MENYLISLFSEKKDYMLDEIFENDNINVEIKLYKKISNDDLTIPQYYLQCNENISSLLEIIKSKSVEERNVQFNVQFKNIIKQWLDEGAGLNSEEICKRTDHGAYGYYR